MQSIPHILVQGGLLTGSFSLNAFFLHQVWKKVSRIDPIEGKLDALSKALKSAEGDIKGTRKKIDVLQEKMSEVSEHVVRLHTDVDWIKETR